MLAEQGAETELLPPSSRAQDQVWWLIFQPTCCHVRPKGSDPSWPPLLVPQLDLEGASQEAGRGPQVWGQGKGPGCGESTCRFLASRGEGLPSPPKSTGGSSPVRLPTICCPFPLGSKPPGAAIPAQPPLLPRQGPWPVCHVPTKCLPCLISPPATLYTFTLLFLLVSGSPDTLPRTCAHPEGGIHSVPQRD